jgi:hypothetical protein
MDLEHRVDDFGKELRDLVEGVSGYFHNTIEEIFADGRKAVLDSAASQAAAANEALTRSIPRFDFPRFDFPHLEIPATVIEASNQASRLAESFSYLNDLSSMVPDWTKSLPKASSYLSEGLRKTVETYSRNPLIDAIEAARQASKLEKFSEGLAERLRSIEVAPLKLPKPPRVEIAKDISERLWNAIREEETSLADGLELVVAVGAHPPIKLEEINDDDPNWIVLTGVDANRKRISVHHLVSGFGFHLETRPIWKTDPPVSGFGPADP